MSFVLKIAVPATLAALYLGWLTASPDVVTGHSSLPAMLDSYLTDEVHLDESDRNALLAGNTVVKTLDADPTKEVAVFGAIWVNAPSTRYVKKLLDVEHFEKGGGFLATKRISNAPKAEDFAAFDISDQDFKDLENCKLEDCALKLDADALQTLRAQVDWHKPNARSEANTVLRRLLLQYVNAYREGGNDRLAVYRDKDHPTFVAGEFRSMIDELPRLTEQLPELKRYLLDYPRATLPDSTNFLYWQQVQFGLKPTVRVSHLVIQQQRPDQTVVASKMLYASHYFWTALELRFLLADAKRGPGFWFVVVNRGRSDGLSGFSGRVIRSRVRQEVENGMRAALTATKTKLETQGR